MMKKSNRIFNIIYSSVLFLFLCVQFGMFVFLKNSSKDIETVILLIYISLNLLLGITYAFILKFFVRKMFDKLNCILDRAIEGDEIEEISEETETALIITKINKFIRIKNEAMNESIKSQMKYERLISDISHQTKIPVSNILIFSELLRENLQSSDSKALQYAKNIVKQTEKLKWLIQALINMSRLENGIIQYNIEKDNVQTLLSLALSGVYLEAEKKNIEIMIKDTPDYQVVCDMKWTSEAIQNVLNNSIKYSSFGSRIDIMIDKFQYFVRITVKDYGIGICTEDIPDVYNRFYRGRNVKNEEGIGIGLYLTKEILTAQEGYIVTSKKERIGTKIMLYIPSSI